MTLDFSSVCFIFSSMLTFSILQTYKGTVKCYSWVIKFLNTLFFHEICLNLLRFLVMNQSLDFTMTMTVYAVQIFFTSSFLFFHYQFLFFTCLFLLLPFHHTRSFSLRIRLEKESNCCSFAAAAPLQLGSVECKKEPLQLQLLRLLRERDREYKMS